MKKYLDYKYTCWGRMYFDENADISKIIDKLEQGYLPSELADDPDLKFDYFEQLIDTEEYITPWQNNEQPTIEIYEGSEFQELVWDNVNKTI